MRNIAIILFFLGTLLNGQSLLLSNFKSVVDDTTLQYSILIDFNDFWGVPTGNWNYLDDPPTDTLLVLIDSTGAAVDDSLFVSSAFVGNNQNGYNSGDNSCFFLDSVMMDAIFTYGSQMVLRHATRTKYRLEIMSSNTTSGRATTFLVNDTYYDSIPTYNNCDNPAIFNIVNPPGDSIYIWVDNGVNVGYVNGIRIKVYEVTE